MLALTLNPGFIVVIAALFAAAAPRGLGAATIAGAALAGLWLLLDREFGAAAAMAQMGLPVILLSLDALNRIFGIAMLLALIVIAPYSGARRSRFEDASILLLAGGAISALFVGDLVSFIAAASLAGLAAAWTVFMSARAGANAAGVRMLMWQGLEGLLFLIGVAFQLAAGGGRSALAHLDITNAGGAFIFAALMIRIGAPFAHVWLKDIVSHASPIGGAALSAFTSMLGVYALARFFTAEPLLIAIGAAMIAVGAFFVAAEDDLRKGAAYGLMMQVGVSVALIGIGSPLAMAGAEGHAFAAIIAFLALQMALGNIVERMGDARVSGLDGLARRMPITAIMLAISGLAASGAPGLALYAVQAVALDAAAQWDTRVVWTLIAAAPAVLFITLFLRPALAAFAPSPAKRAKLEEAPFSMLLGATLASFFCIAIGAAPAWLYNLMPAELAFQPYAIDRLAQRLELLGAAGACYLALRFVRAAPRDRFIEITDIDALYRGPAAAAGRWLGVIALRIFGAAEALLAGMAQRVGQFLANAIGTLDKPYACVTVAAPWLAIAGLLLLVLFSKT